MRIAAQAFAQNQGHGGKAMPNTDGISLSMLAGMEMDYWPENQKYASPQNEARRFNIQSQIERIPEPGFEHPKVVEPPWRADPHSADPQLQSLIIDFKGMDEEQLYAGILATEDALVKRQEAHLETEARLRSELGRLASEIPPLQIQARESRQEAEDIAGAQERCVEQGFEAAQLRKKLQSTKRAVLAIQFFEQKSRQQLSNMQEARHERALAEEEAEFRKREWEISIEELNRVAEKLDQCQKKKAELLKASKKKKLAKKGEQSGGQLKEFKELVGEQASLLKELNDSRNAYELKKLLEEERRELGGQRCTLSVMVEEIAELEEHTEALERRGQRAVQDLREALLRSSAKEQDLQRQKLHADEWLQSMWSTICQQKREEHMLDQRAKEEDIWTAHLQKRTDALVEELAVLESDVNDTLDPWGQPEPNEEEREQQMWDDLARLRQKRRAAQHRLAWYIAKREPLRKVLDTVKAEQRQLRVLLEPIQHLLDKM